MGLKFFERPWVRENARIVGITGALMIGISSFSALAVFGVKKLLFDERSRPSIQTNAHVVTDVVIGLTDKGERAIKELIESEQGIKLGDAKIAGLHLEINEYTNGTDIRTKGLLIPWATPRERPSHELLANITNLIRADLTSIRGGPGNYRLSFREDGLFMADDFLVAKTLDLLW